MVAVPPESAQRGNVLRSLTPSRLPRRLTILVPTLFCAWSLSAQGSTEANSAKTPPSAQNPAPASAAPSDQPAKAPEVATVDTPAMFRVRVNLVLVRVVVRDSQGKVVENLHREDFVLADGRKPQVISFFNVETPASRAIPVTTAANASGEPVNATPVSAVLPAMPQRF